jgi:AsmA-like C-terminal region
MAKSEGKISPTTVFSRMKGEVVAQHGTAVLSHSVVAAPGARAELSGTYSLVAKTVDLRGLLQTTGKLSDTTFGFETVLLKAISPLWKQKNKSMSSVPFTVSGKAQDPKFSLELKRKHL